jgi:RND family efflux transporter MFP subunit
VKISRQKVSVSLVGVLVIAAATGVIVSNRANSAPAQGAVAKSVIAVSTIVPQRQEWPVILTADGSIVAWQEAIIAAETGGLRIAALHAEVGDRVKRGQVLAELANASTEADLRKYEASLASARASLAKAHTSAERARQLQGGKGSLSDEQINEYLIAEQTAQADVDSAEAQVQAQRITLGQTHVVAVDDGIITSKSAVLGQVVSAGTELFRLQRQGRLEWQAEVDARQLAQVKPGARASVKLPDGRVLAGRVRLVAPTLSTSTSRANVLVKLPDGGAAGMFASGSIEAGTRLLLSVPQTAVVLRDGLSYVFELRGDKHVARHRVVTGMLRDGRIEITSGVRADMRIVASGGGFLADGDQVSFSGDAK